MNDREFDRRLHEHLDARRDPLDDPAIVAFLGDRADRSDHADRGDHAERLAGFARMRAALHALHALPRAARPPRRRGPRLAAAAGATLALGVFAWRAAAAPPSAAAPRSRILGAELVEIRPRAHAAVQFAVYQPLVASTDATLETYERRSQRR